VSAPSLAYGMGLPDISVLVCVDLWIYLYLYFGMVLVPASVRTTTLRLSDVINVRTSLLGLVFYHI
jgi:hypothetical protein